MCSRITLTLPDAATLMALLGITDHPADADLYRPRYNVAPSESHWVVTGPQPRLELHPWGKHPHHQINSRLETLEQHRAFPRGERPCVVCSDGFLEWEGPPQDRRPVWFHRHESGLLLMAGVMDYSGFSVVTVPATGPVAPIHDRMPLILTHPDMLTWLHASAPGSARELFHPSLADALVPTRVSKRINKAGTDDPQCLAPDTSPKQLSLL